MLSVFVLAAAVAGNTTTFDFYENADNAHTQHGKKNFNAAVSDLGIVESVMACQHACVCAFGADPTTGCTSFTFYHDNYNNSDWAGHCFGDTTGAWTPFYSTYVNPMSASPSCFWGNVTSGQNQPARYVTPCVDEADCSYNGICSDAGTCVCHPQWMGKHCGQLHLVATGLDAGLQSRDSLGRVSSWGGSVVRGDDGVFHMWAAEMTNNTGILVWMSNSRVRHAVSRNGPLGPFLPADIAFGLWGHEPTVARAPSGEYVLFWTAHFGSEVPCSGIPCEDGNNGNSVMDPRKHCLNIHDCTNPTDLNSYMSYSQNPAGPWSTPALVPKGDFGSGDTNLAPIINEDGSLFGLGRPGWIWRAPDWRNLSTYVVEKIDATILGEDPFVYRDHYNASVLHALSHAGHYDAKGGHVWSTDGGRSWNHHNDIDAYGSLIKYTDGSQRSLSRRERPHLVLDERGVPLALTNGVTDGWPCTYRVCPYDYCHTALQSLNQN
tara:strand:+ start:2531 stop:4003 length:1473 start_codon:yes stop_codon:yes gene_type:complete